MTEPISQPTQQIVEQQSKLAKFFANWKAVVGIVFAIVAVIGVSIGVSYLMCSKPIPPTQAISNPEGTKEISAQQSLVNTMNSILYDMKHGKKAKTPKGKK